MDAGFELDAGKNNFKVVDKKEVLDSFSIQY